MLYVTYITEIKEIAKFQFYYWGDIVLMGLITIELVFNLL